MLKLIPVLLLLPTIGFGQSSKSIETVVGPGSSKTEAQELEEREERRVRQEWDREEAQAQAMEERRRQIDEERAMLDDLPLQQTRRR